VQLTTHLHPMPKVKKDWSYNSVALYAILGVLHKKCDVLQSISIRPSVRWHAEDVLVD
jgi:hypothetical protein